jgi:predicted DCC family thiol-disulfide oxidoreductase YuxK
VPPNRSAEERTPWKARRPRGDVLLVGNICSWRVEASVGRAASSSPQAAPVLLYDGVCGFCNHAVQTILRFDRRGTLRFAALDSDFARTIVQRHPCASDVDSMVVVDNPGQLDEHVSVRSAAGLRVAQYPGGPWRLLLLARAIPPRLRDWLYDRFASIRYRIFGKYDTCPVLSEEMRARSLGS